MKWNDLCVKFEAVKNQGHLIFFPSQVRHILDGGIKFQVRICPTIKHKQASDSKDPEKKSSDGSKWNPFLPYETYMEVSPLSKNPDHVILFNKFALVPNHLLIITRHYEEQASTLTEKNLAAALEALNIYESDSVDWLVFYNRGQIAGSSQHHRHLQMVPFTAENPIPLESVIPKDTNADSIPQYRHFCHFFAPHSPKVTAQSLHEVYTKALAKLPAGCEDYNLLFTRRWMLLIPRKSDASGGVQMNSLPFAGCFMMRGEDEFVAWQDAVKTPLAAFSLATYPSCN